MKPIMTGAAMSDHKLRDNVAAWLCNLILRVVASRSYRDTVTGALRYGIAASLRDHRDGKLMTPGEVHAYNNELL